MTGIFFQDPNSGVRLLQEFSKLDLDTLTLVQEVTEHFGPNQLLGILAAINAMVPKEQVYTKEGMGKATWIWDDDLGVHIPGCSKWRRNGTKCLSGPLTGDQITTGDCGSDGHMI